MNSIANMNMNSQVNSQPDEELLASAMERPYRLAPPALVRDLSDVLGTPAVAEIGGVKNTRSVYQWLSGEREPERLDALRFALQLACMLRAFGETDKTVAAWFNGLNPRIGDATPLSLLVEGKLDEIQASLMKAARAFVASKFGS